MSTLAKMKAAKRWLLWRFEKAAGKPKPLKVPYYQNGNLRGKTDTPEDWAQLVSYDEAMAVLAKGEFSGIGFALGADETGNSWQGIDLDKLIQHPENSDLVTTLPGYSEFSPSGDGMHFIGYGNQFKPLKRDKLGCEAYASGRYFTFTGNNGRDAPLVDLAEIVDGTLRPRFNAKTPSVPSGEPSSCPLPGSLNVLELAGILAKIPIVGIDYETDDPANKQGWLTVIMGVNHEFAGTPDEGAAIGVVDYWSSRDETKYTPGLVASKWASVKPGGGVTMEHVRLMAGLPRYDLKGFPAIPGFNDMPKWEPDTKEKGEAKGEQAPPFPAPFPGVMADMLEAVLPMANKPQPELTTLALLIGMAASVNGRYYFGNGQRANLFGIGVLETGLGKDWVRLGGEELAYHGGARRIDAPASGEGLEDSLVDFGGVIMSVDEIGFMFAATNANNAQSHLVRLKREILRLFSASRAVIHGRLKAGGVTRTIKHPCLNIMGFTTPGVLGRNMTGNDVSSGELPRYLMVFGRNDIPHRRTKTKFVMPPNVIRQAKILTTAVSFAQKDDEGLIEIKASTEGDAALDRAIGLFATSSASAGAFNSDLLTRAYEKIERIAMVLAVWVSPSAPVIEPAMVDWATMFVTYSNWSLSTFAEKHMVSAISIADANHIKSIAQKIMSGKLTAPNENQKKIIAQGYVPWSMLLNKSKHGVKEFTLAIEHLVQIDEVELSSLPFKLEASGGTKSVKVLKFN